MELVSYHRLLEANESSNHEQQITCDRRSERQSETGNSCIHERENCDERNTASNETRENVETRRDPSVHCKLVRYDSSQLGFRYDAHLPTSSSMG